MMLRRSPSSRPWKRQPTSTSTPSAPHNTKRGYANDWALWEEFHDWLADQLGAGVCPLPDIAPCQTGCASPLPPPSAGASHGRPLLSVPRRTLASSPLLALRVSPAG